MRYLKNIVFACLWLIAFQQLPASAALPNSSTGGTNIGNTAFNSDAIVVGDVDNDGDMDVIAGNTGQTNKLYLNDGSGGFAATGTNIGSETDTTKYLALADVDGDGDLDLLVGNSGQNKLYLNNGSGGFSSTGTNIGSETDVTLGLAVGDLDNDGDLDVVAGELSSTAKMYLNDGAGSFSATGTAIGSVEDATQAIALADLDNDGDLDVVIGNDSESISKIHLNDGSANWSSATNLSPFADNTNALILADVDQDGDIDLMTGNFGQSNKIYLNTGDASFSSYTAIGNETDNSITMSLGDMDGDGDADLVVGTYNGTNKLYLNNGSGFTTDAGTVFGSESDTTFSVAVADVDLDGDLDVLTGNRGQTNKLYLNAISSDSQTLTNTSTAGTNLGLATDRDKMAAVGDVDNDGDLDLLMVNNNDFTRLYLNDGSVGFTSTSAGTAIGTTGNSTASLVLGDIDNDGDLDFITGNSPGVNTLYLNNGGGFDNGTAVGSESDQTHSLVLGDVDSDGDLDLITGNLGANNRLYLNNGSGGFASSGTSIGSETDRTETIILTDIDNDGDLDLVAGSYILGSNRLYLNDGSGGFPNGSTAGTLVGESGNQYALDIVSGDVDRDGDNDLIVGYSNRSNKLYLNNGSGTFPSSGTVIGSETGGSHIALGDMDSDGDLDLVVGDTGSTTKIYLNNGSGVFPNSTTAGTSIGSDTDVKKSSPVLFDIDNDGDLDIVSPAFQVTTKIYLNRDYTTMPVISLVGSATVNLELGSAYTDAGATAVDNIDGTITSSIATVNPVNVNAVGTYTVTYNVSDAAGNAANQVTRTVNVTADVTVPVITRLGDATVSLELGSTYTDAGATAVDNIDGTITSSIVTVNPVNVNAVGTYTVTYNVDDAAGNAATQVSRTVNVTADVTVPVITLLGDATVSLELGSTYTDAGATAVDNIDGTITSSIVTVNPVNVNAVGTYTVTYNVDDAAGNAATQVSRTVNVTADVTVPVITLLGDATVSLELGSSYTDAGATAVDNIDGTITSNIATVNTVDVNTVGTYTVTYNVDDAAGNAATQVSRTVNVTADVTVPVITLLGDATVSLELGSSYTDAGATAVDNIDGTITSSIVTVNPVNVNAVGTYTVTYNVDDAAGNAATQVSRTVNVTADVTVPVITLLGDATVSLELGSSYTDAGATATDNIDGTITSSIVTVNPVNVNAVGTYTVTYNVDDAAGNAATQVSRTVNVTADVTVPVITLLGDATVSLELGSSYTDAGATATDNIDGTITSSIVTVNTVDVDTVGTYSVTYNVSDAAGNSATQVTRTVTITADVTVPVVTLVGDATVSLELGSSYTDAGATATDNIDGTITSSIVTVNTVDVDTVGTYSVTYNVSDAAGNSATQVTRTVTITADVTVPVITLVGDATVSLELGSTYTDAGATAVDNIDGTITSNIATVNTVDVNTVGTYSVTYNVSDAAGNSATQVTRTVTITADVTIPVITLT